MNRKRTESAAESPHFHSRKYFSGCHYDHQGSIIDESVYFVTRTARNVQKMSHKQEKNVVHV